MPVGFLSVFADLGWALQKHRELAAARLRTDDDGGGNRIVVDLDDGQAQALAGILRALPGPNDDECAPASSAAPEGAGATGDESAGWVPGLSRQARAELEHLIRVERELYGKLPGWPVPATLRELERWLEALPP
jgi:hypothetical protein